MIEYDDLSMIYSNCDGLIPDELEQYYYNNKVMTQDIDLWSYNLDLYGNLGYNTNINKLRNEYVRLYIEQVLSQCNKGRTR